MAASTADLPQLPHPLDRPTLTIPEAGLYLGLQRVPAYTAANRGYIPTIWTSPHRRVVPTAGLWRLLELDPGSDSAPEGAES